MLFKIFSRLPTFPPLKTSPPKTSFSSRQKTTSLLSRRIICPFGKKHKSSIKTKPIWINSGLSNANSRLLLFGGVKNLVAVKKLVYMCILGRFSSRIWNFSVNFAGEGEWRAECLWSKWNVALKVCHKCKMGIIWWGHF